MRMAILALVIGTASAIAAQAEDIRGLDGTIKNVDTKTWAVTAVRKDGTSLVLKIPPDIRINKDYEQADRSVIKEGRKARTVYFKDSKQAWIFGVFVDAPLPADWGDK
jgi:hypothetical protein